MSEMRTFSWDRFYDNNNRHRPAVLILDNLIERIVYLAGKRQMALYSGLDEIFRINRDTT